MRHLDSQWRWSIGWWLLVFEEAYSETLTYEIRQLAWVLGTFSGELDVEESVSA